MNWKQIFDHLKAAGYKVYAVGGHTGECNEHYIVLRNNGETLNYSLEVPEYEVLMYCPVRKYVSFEDYIAGVKACLNELYPALRLVDSPYPHYLDNDVHAYMTSLIYQTQRIKTTNRITK